MPYRVLKRVQRGSRPAWTPGQVLSDEVAGAARRLPLLIQAGYLRRIPKPRVSTDGLTVADVREKAATASLSEVQALYDAEVRGKARKTALAALAARLEDA